MQCKNTARAVHSANYLCFMLIYVCYLWLSPARAQTKISYSLFNKTNFDYKVRLKILISYEQPVSTQNLLVFIKKSVLLGLIQYLQCLAGGFSAAMSCHPECSVRSLVMRSSFPMTSTQYEDSKLTPKAVASVLIAQACSEVMSLLSGVSLTPNTFKTNYIFL